MTIRLQLEGSGLAALQKEAAALGVTVEQLPTDILGRHVGSTTRTIPDAVFRAAMADTLREDEELLRRLARGPDGRATFDDAADYVLAKNAELYRRLADGPELGHDD